MTETKQQAAQDDPAIRTVVIGEKTDSPREVPLPEPVSRPEKRLLLIDGHSLAFRAFFALSRAAEYGGGPGFVTSEGVHTEGVYGFVNTMVKLVREEKPTHLVVSFDLEGPTLRSREDGEYKGGRDETPEEDRAAANAAPGPRGRTPRAKRSSVPSWDDIVFGNRT